MTPVAGPSRPCNGKTDDNSDNSNSLRFPEVSRSFSLNFLFLFLGESVLSRFPLPVGSVFHADGRRVVMMLTTSSVDDARTWD